MKKNGFTLIELLAVLAILAILALLITPTVFSTIEKFKNDSRDKQLSMIEAAAGDWSSDKLKHFTKGTFYITVGDLKAEGYLEKDFTDPIKGKNFPNDSIIKIEFNGKRYKIDYIEDSGTTSLDSNLENGPRIKLTGNSIMNITSSFSDPGVIAYSNTSSVITSSVTKTIKKNNSEIVTDINKSGVGKYTIYYKVTSNGKTQVVTRNVINNSYPIGEIVYFDPTGKVADCASGKEWTESNTSTTCYKWNVIKDNGNSIDLLLDHNTTTYVPWNSSGNNSYGPGEVYNKLKTDTSAWTNVQLLTSSDNATISAQYGTYTINYSGLRARLISGKEIANIIGNQSWQPSGASISFTTQQWLYSNTYSSGYWTDAATTAHALGAWYVSSGTFATDRVVLGDYIGLRPVARVLKSNL